jgi:hypothetical protein
MIGLPVHPAYNALINNHTYCLKNANAQFKEIEWLHYKKTIILKRPVEIVKVLSIQFEISLVLKSRTSWLRINWSEYYGNYDTCCDNIFRRIMNASALLKNDDFVHLFEKEKNDVLDFVSCYWSVCFAGGFLYPLIYGQSKISLCEWIKHYDRFDVEEQKIPEIIEIHGWLVGMKSFHSYISDSITKIITSTMKYFIVFPKYFDTYCFYDLILQIFVLSNILSWSGGQ